jgi:predicted DNA binding CopG/RHH family protein
MAHIEFSWNAKKSKKQITIRIESEIIDYFKRLAKKSSIPYQGLINMYLLDCVHSNKNPVFKWA